MRLVLVGADFEENLGMCMIAAAAESAGHRAEVVPFQGSEERTRVVAKVLAARPDVVGLAIGTRPDCVAEEVLNLLAELVLPTLALLKASDDEGVFNASCTTWLLLVLAT